MILSNRPRSSGPIYQGKPFVNIYDWAMERDSIRRMTDTVARAAALRHLVAARNGVSPVVNRVFVGRDRATSALLNLSDREGKPRLRLVVDSLGSARVEFLDAHGNATNALTGTSR